MYLPTEAAPTSRLLALGEFLLVALRSSAAGADLAPFLERRCDDLAAAARRSAEALRVVTPHRVAHRFAEQHLAVVMVALTHEAGKLGLSLAPLSGREARVARAEDLVRRIERHPYGTEIRQRHVPPVREAIDAVAAELASCTRAFDAYERVAAEEAECRAAFVKLYADIAKELGNRMPETMRAAFFDDPCTRRAGSRMDVDVDEPSFEQTPTHIAA